MPYPTKSFEADIPPDLLDLFALDGDRVRWSSKPVTGRRTTKRAPWGDLAGGKPVVGRGALVTVSGFTLLTADILFALRHAGEWAWQVGSTVPCAPCGEDVDRWRAIIRERFAMDRETVVWAVDRGFTASRSPRYCAGSPVTGLRLSGFRGSIVTTSSVGILLTDVRSVLETGLFPFEEWD